MLKMLYFMFSIDPQISQSRNSWTNLACSWKVLLCQAVKIFSLVTLIFIWINTDTWTLKFYDILEQFTFTQLVNTPTHIQGHILDALCVRDSFFWTICPKVIGGLSDHQAIMLSLIFPVRESCKFQCVFIRKIHKINILDFRTDILKSDLIDARSKLPVFLVINTLIPWKASLTSTPQSRRKIYQDMPRLVSWTVTSSRQTTQEEIRAGMAPWKLSQ